jgi:predicted membrane-bound spermidine synthase
MNHIEIIKKASKAQVMACNAHLSSFGDWGLAFEETYSYFESLEAESKSAY